MSGSSKTDVQVEDVQARSFINAKEECQIAKILHHESTGESVIGSPKQASKPLPGHTTFAYHHVEDAIIYLLQ